MSEHALSESELKSRTIHLIGAITDETFDVFCRQMTELEGVNGDDITIVLSSPGGEAYAALAFSARIRRSTCFTNIRAYGLVASAAVLVLAAGTHRFMSHEAWLMVHEDQLEGLGGSVTEVRKASEVFDRLEDQWAVLLARRSKTKAEVWRRLHKETNYLTAKECKKLGIIDYIF